MENPLYPRLKISHQIELETKMEFLPAIPEGVPFWLVVTTYLLVGALVICAAVIIGSKTTKVIINLVHSVEPEINMIRGWFRNRANQPDVEPKKYLFGAATTQSNILVGFTIVTLATLALYISIFFPVAKFVTGEKVGGVIFGMLFALGTFALLGVPRTSDIEPEHVGVLKFLNAYVKRLLPAGKVWLPPFCSYLSVNVGEQMVDMRDTDVYIQGGKQAKLHLQMTLQVNNPYLYAEKLASIGKSTSPDRDAVVDAVVGLIKSATRLYCKDIPTFEKLNEEQVNIVNKVLDDSVDPPVSRQVADWGVVIKKLFIRTIILPADYVFAANAAEREKAELISETKDVQTLVKLGDIIKNGYDELNDDGTVKKHVDGFSGVPDKERLEAAQIQQKRLSANVIRGSGMAFVNAKQGDAS